ncbi:Uncharacterized protein TCAP_04213 [Tolypocladium capitatum]|uniref:Uncharacterized protein n=1 Tax=Tolypocladium capitatum TaxID=45235 RepID=A0A2K3QEA6_9HYPO|nr:Uncharacterized protein TCAP_04213 [Tolypocladium capitatum]
MSSAAQSFVRPRPSMSNLIPLARRQMPCGLLRDVPRCPAADSSRGAAGRKQLPKRALLTSLRRTSEPPPPTYPSSALHVLLIKMRVFLLLAALYGARALPASQSAGSCTPDALFTSLYRGGRQFCSSVLDGRCNKASTPTQFATYDPGVISSHVSFGAHTGELGGRLTRG